MVAENDKNEEDLEENEVSFFKCSECGSRTLCITNIVDEVETVQETLPCRCGQQEDAAYRTEEIKLQIEQRGHLLENRHFIVEETEQEELDRGTLSEDIICEECYKKRKHRADLWQVSKPTSEGEDSDLTISCEGCDREIEFGYSHAHKQGRIFLGQDDKEFNPWKTFPDPKYVERWKERNWLRPAEPRSHGRKRSEPS